MDLAHTKIVCENVKMFLIVYFHHPLSIYNEFCIQICSEDDTHNSVLKIQQKEKVLVCPSTKTYWTIIDSEHDPKNIYFFQNVYVKWFTFAFNRR